MAKQTSSKNIQKIEPLVKETLLLPGKIHKKASWLGTLEELEKLFPGFKIFLDDEPSSLI